MTSFFMRHLLGCGVELIWWNKLDPGRNILLKPRAFEWAQIYIVKDEHGRHLRWTTLIQFAIQTQRKRLGTDRSIYRKE